MEGLIQGGASLWALGGGTSWGAQSGGFIMALGGGMSWSLYQGVHYTGTLFLPLF